jgi:hypothetical protein
MSGGQGTSKSAQNVAKTETSSSLGKASAQGLQCQRCTRRSLRQLRPGASRQANSSLYQHSPECWRDWRGQRKRVREESGAQGGFQVRRESSQTAAAASRAALSCHLRSQVVPYHAYFCGLER